MSSVFHPFSAESRLLWEFGGGMGGASLGGEGKRAEDREKDKDEKGMRKPPDSDTPTCPEHPDERHDGKKAGFTRKDVDHEKKPAALKKLEERDQKREQGKLKMLEEMIVATGGSKTSLPMNAALLRDAEAHLKGRPPERKATGFADAGRAEKEEVEWVTDPESADKRKRPDEDQGAELQWM